MYKQKIFSNLCAFLCFSFHLFYNAKKRLFTHSRYEQKTIKSSYGRRNCFFILPQHPLCVMILSTMSSVERMASAPIEVRLCMLRSTSLSMMPSAELTHFPSMDSKAERIAVDTPEAIFREQLGLAPSQIMPVKLAIMFSPNDKLAHNLHPSDR